MILTAYSLQPSDSSLHLTSASELVVLCLALMLTDGSFLIQNDSFLLNREEFRVLSGSVHYFRIHPDYWLDRLTRARAMGLNAIQFGLMHPQISFLHGSYSLEPAQS